MGPRTDNPCMMLLLVALGGAVGAVARYGMGGWIQTRSGPGFPWGTLGVNLLGSFLTGLLLPALATHGGTGTPVSLLLKVGVLGAFTTFSTFAFEAFRLFEDGDRVRGMSYVAASLGGGLASIAAGLWLGQHLF